MASYDRPELARWLTQADAALATGEGARSHSWAMVAAVQGAVALLAQADEDDDG